MLYRLCPRLLPGLRSSIRGIISLRYRALVSLDTVRPHSTMELSSVVSVLEQFAPLRLAESWDNVGMLVAPSTDVPINIVLLTNDLTPAVLDEAERLEAGLVISYHPPVFSALKRLVGYDRSDWKARLVVRCLERRIAVYSPHTCWDACAGGVNDWLASAFETSSVLPITPSPGLLPNMCSHCVLLHVPFDVIREGTNESTLNRIKEMASTNHNVATYSCVSQEGAVRVEFSCPEYIIKDITALINNSDLGQHLRITKLEKLGPLSDTGMGRVCTLFQPLTLNQVVHIIKRYLGLTHVRLALGQGRSMEEASVKTVSLCAGSGASVLRQCPHSDVYWTGEMSHHDVLDAVHRGASVVLCEHSNTERGFLEHFAPTLQEMIGGETEVIVSQTDADPFTFV